MESGGHGVPVVSIKATYQEDTHEEGRQAQHQTLQASAACCRDAAQLLFRA